MVATQERAAFGGEFLVQIKALTAQFGINTKSKDASQSDSRSTDELHIAELLSVAEGTTTLALGFFEVTPGASPEKALGIKDSTLDSASAAELGQYLPEYVDALILLSVYM